VNRFSRCEEAESDEVDEDSIYGKIVVEDGNRGILDDVGMFVRNVSSVLRLANF
jgi:hypothetical protein